MSAMRQGDLMFRLILLVAILPGIARSVAVAAPSKPAVQKLADFRRVVLPDKPNAVQKAAAEELARYVGRITGKDVPVVSAGRYDFKADGLTFFVGGETARALAGLDLGPWKLEEYLLRTVARGTCPGRRRWRRRRLVAHDAGRDHAGRLHPARRPPGVPMVLARAVRRARPVERPTPWSRRSTSARPRSSSIRSVSGRVSPYHTTAFREAARKWARRTPAGLGPARRCSAIAGTTPFT